MCGQGALETLPLVMTRAAMGAEWRWDFVAPATEVALASKREQSRVVWLLVCDAPWKYGVVRSNEALLCSGVELRQSCHLLLVCVRLALMIATGLALVRESI